MTEAEQQGDANSAPHRAARPHGENAALTEANRAARPQVENGAMAEANREIGGPGFAGNAVWHSRGYLPHFDNSEAIQHVTFHLADSLPREVAEHLDAELNHLPATQQEVERRKRVSAWLDVGHGCCVLREPEVAAMIQDTFLFFDAQRYRLLEWVVMPNHVHVLFQPIHGWTVPKIVASWKKFTARKICDHWRGNGHPGNTGHPAVWHREYWDRYIRHAQHLAQAMDYIRQNPVEAGLVPSADEWQWSSAYGVRTNS